MGADRWRNAAPEGPNIPDAPPNPNPPNTPPPGVPKPPSAPPTPTDEPPPKPIDDPPPESEPKPPYTVGEREVPGRQPNVGSTMPRSLDDGEVFAGRSK